MKQLSDHDNQREDLRNSIIGLGERSMRKSYYPELQKRIAELEKTNKELLLEISQRQQAQAFQKKLEEQLQQAQKMEAIGQLAGGIAHDFNNILTAIIGYGNLLQMKMEEGDALRHDVDKILAGSERAAELTRSLLAFSRRQIIDPRPINLNDVVKGIEWLLFRIIGEGVELKTILKHEDLITMADSGQLEQVLMNLSTNARDAMPDGGVLLFETDTIRMDEDYIKTHGYGNPGPYALLAVTDSGCGMDEETRKRIFEPFFTTKETGKGTGLGLAMVYGIIKQHNGYINVYSEPRRGTTFKIYLPLIKSEVWEKAKVAPVAYCTGGTERVLVAEDDKEIRELTRDVLERFGYTVITAEDGEDAIDKFSGSKDDIQVMLLDVMMPKKNGREVYEKISTIKPDIKVIFLSGYTGNILHKKGILSQKFDFIQKPIAPKVLLAKIREVLDRNAGD